MKFVETMKTNGTTKKITVVDLNDGWSAEEDSSTSGDGWGAEEDT